MPPLPQTLGSDTNRALPERLAHKRASALFVEFVTSRQDVVAREASTQDPFDFTVAIARSGRSTRQSFGVQVKGVNSMNGVFSVAFDNRQLSLIQHATLPLCLFVFNMFDDQAYYRWLREPVVPGHGAKDLRISLDANNLDRAGSEKYFIHSSEFAPLDDGQWREILDVVGKWYAIAGDYTSRCRNLPSSPEIAPVPK